MAEAGAIPPARPAGVSPPGPSAPASLAGLLESLLAEMTALRSEVEGLRMDLAALRSGLLPHDPSAGPDDPTPTPPQRPGGSTGGSDDALRPDARRRAEGINHELRRRLALMAGGSPLGGGTSAEGPAASDDTGIDLLIDQLHDLADANLRQG